ncbi:PspA/IM30 family protein [Listeria sp. SHR_NRA_18]|nr:MULTISPECIES: PspA/IM30 family protein [Listeria]RQW68631.1 PspA/IM30 family protein [Listeria sp. SHR_NRA_18]WAO23321.1 PspA/IM30 family protein [Listeria newyorkensis]
MKEKREEKKRNSVSYYMDQTKKEMKDIERAVDKQRELKSLFYKECTEIEKYIEKREYQAGIAEEAGETKLANFAKEEVAQYKEQLATTQSHYDNASEQLEKLELKMHEMRLKWKNLKTQHLAETAEKNAAETAEKMDKVIHDMSWGSVTDYHEAQKQRDLANTAKKQADMTSELSQTFDELMAELEKKTAKGKEAIKGKTQDFTQMVDEIIEREKQNFKKKDNASMEEMLEDLERDAKKQAKEDKPEEEKEVLIPELEKKDVPNEDKKEQE